MSDIKQELLAEAGKIVNGARRKAYGTPEDNFERIARFWQAYFENTGRGDMRVTAADVSPLMRLMKEARLCESPDHKDSFVDIIGYTLTGAEVNKVEAEVNPVQLFMADDTRDGYVGLYREEYTAQEAAPASVNVKIGKPEGPEHDDPPDNTKYLYK